MASVFRGFLTFCFFCRPERLATRAPPDELNRLDREAAERIAARDLDGFCRFLGRTGATICGANPIALYLALLDRVDPERKISGEIVSMADSGEVTGDYSHVVDYAGILFR